jgi:SAM-dependent methyltransferase
VNRPDVEQMVRLLSWACTAPSEALVRYCELRALEDLPLPHPLLEIGCGNGRFAAIAVGHIERAVDVDLRNVKRARSLDGIYDRVDQADARALPPEPGAYRTVFANSVLSVLPDVDNTLALCHRQLCPGGTLVASVQLPTLYRSLLLNQRWYVRRRHRQQDIVTLRSAEQWSEAMTRVGFSHLTTVPYMPSPLGRFWDAIDAPASIGHGRYQVSTAARLAVNLLPRRLRYGYYHRWANFLLSAYDRHREGPPCHLLIVARK